VRGMLAAYSAGVMLGSYVIHLQTSLLINTALAVLLPAMGYWLARRDTDGDSARRSMLLLAALCAGLAYHAAWAWQATAARLLEAQAGVDITVTGTVIDLPRRDELATRFLFNVSSGPDSLQGERILLRDYGELTVSGGQRWQFRVRLQQPRGLANPGTFDYEAWLLQQRIRATGYVRDSQAAQLLGVSRTSPAWWRQRVAIRLAGLTADDPLLSMLLPALVYGDSGHFDTATWDTLTRTGTNHLFVISGLHIGLVAGWCYLLVNYLVRLTPVARFSVPSQKLAAVAAMVGAALYSLIAGFGLPAQRALIMILVFMLAGLAGRSVNIGVRLLLALAVVLSLNPLAANSAGFWLSFTAVGALLLFLKAGKTDAPQRLGWAGLVKPQWLVFLALFVPLSIWMGQVSLIAPLVNMVAIPTLALVVVPLSLLLVITSVLSASLAALVLKLVSVVMNWTMHGLDFFAHGLGELGGLLQYIPASVSGMPVLLACLAVLLLLVPVPWTIRWLALPLSLGYLLPGGINSARDGVFVHVLDVGQGLAVLVEQNRRFLLYDTGARLSESYDMGSSVVLPVLVRLGARRLDWLVISHGDNDHAGGYHSLAAAIPVRTLITGDEVDTGAAPALPCRAGQVWQWEEATISVLHPDRSYATSNDNSCVLRISVANQALLLAGDITRAVEWQLASHHGSGLQSDILLAPHHGSSTSSSYPLLKAVAPDWGVFSAASNNSFGHPADEVVARYQALDIATLNTAETGMISFQLGEESPSPETFRDRQRRYWRWSQNSP